MVRLIYSSNKFKTDYGYEGSRLIPTGKLKMQVLCPEGFTGSVDRFAIEACIYFEGILQMNNHNSGTVQVAYVGNYGMTSEGDSTVVDIESVVSFL